VLAGQQSSVTTGPYCLSALPTAVKTAVSREEQKSALMMSRRFERPVPRRGLSRVEAATYLGISPSKFDELVQDGRMPAPKRIDGRKIWDIYSLDMAFDALPSENETLGVSTWDDFRTS
jgi:excisionase family DNA binding protein